MTHFDDYKIPVLVCSEEAHQQLIKSRAHISTCIRGSDVISVFREATRRWHTEPQWREDALACLNSFVAFFGESRTADVTQIDLIPSLFCADLWESKLAHELNLQGALDSVYEGARSDALLAYRPLGVVLHVCPGNSFLGGIDSLLHGIVTGNQNIVKLSRNTPAIISVLLDLLNTCGLPENQANPVLWEGGNNAVESTICEGVDGVIAWGGDATMRHYKARLPVGVRFLEYGPKLSFSVLTAQGLQDKNALAGLIKDVCAYEQASCSSSQFLLVEMPEEDPADYERYQRHLLDRISQLFTEATRDAPPAAKSRHEQVEMLKALEQAKLAKVQGRGDFIDGYPDWLVVWMEGDKPIQPSPLFRTWLIYPYQNKRQLTDRLLPIRHYLQTAGVACAPDEQSGIADLLWQSGVNRVVAPGRSSTATKGAPHDGGSILAGLCRTTSLELNEAQRSLWKSGTRDETLEALRDIVNAARHAPYYERSRQHAEFCRYPSWESFHALPWLSKHDFYQFGPPHSSDLLTVPFQEAKNAYLFTTGGSTGEPKYAMYNRREWDEGVAIFCRALEKSGLTSSDRVANLYNGGGLWSAFIAVTEALEQLGCLNLPVGGSMNPDELAKLLHSLGTTAVYGLTSTLLRLANAVEKNPQMALRIPTLFYGGEHMSDSMRSYLARIFDAKIIRSPVYASVDAGCIGHQCQCAANGVFHALERYAYVEIADKETGRPVEKGQIGEIIVTNFSRRLYPIIRVRTGDYGREVSRNCSCGNTNFTFELLGRSDDMIRVATANVHIPDVDRLCEKFHTQLSLVYQLRIDRIDLDDRYVLCIETKLPLHKEDLKDLTAEVKQSYLGMAEEVNDAIKKGLLRHFDLALFEPGALEANQKTGKIRRVVDKRN